MVLSQDFTFHDLRKTFLTHLLADTGGNIGAGQQLAGHSTPAVTSTYYLGRNIAFLSQAVESLRLVEPASAAEHKVSTRRLMLVSNAAGSTRKGQ